MTHQHLSILEYYQHLSVDKYDLAEPIITALDQFGTGKLQWNMPVYYRDNAIIRPGKNTSRRYFGIKKCKTGILYI